MAKPRSGRKVNSTESAMARTNRPHDYGGSGVTTVADADLITKQLADAERQLAELTGRAAADGFENVATGIGTSLDRRTSNTFTIARFRTQFEIESMYASSWPGAKLVDKLPEEATREWLDFNWNGHDDEAEGARAAAIRDAATDLGMREAVCSAGKWGRLYGGAAVVASIKGDDDWSKPLNIDRIPKGGVEMFHVLDRYRLYPAGNIDKKPGINFGKPTYYGIAEAAENVALVHWSRVMIFRGKELPYFEWQRNGRWDGSVLQHVWDNIVDYEAVRTAVNAMVPESNVDILKVPNLATMVSTPDGVARLQKRLATGAAIKSALHVWVMEGGNAIAGSQGAEEYSQKVSQFSGVNAVLEGAKDDLAGATDYPMTILFGRSPGGMNATGDSDNRNWIGRVKAYQDTELAKPTMRMARMLARHTFGSIPDGFGLKWKPISSPTEGEQAETDAKNAATAKAYVEMGAMAPQAVTRELVDRKTFRTLTKDDITEAERMHAEEEDAAKKAASAKVVVATGGGKQPPKAPAAKG